MSIKKQRIQVGIAGVGGYTGFRLLKILALHPIFHPVYIASSSKGDLASMHPNFYGVIERLGLEHLREVRKLDVQEAAQACELIFLALPHKQSMSFVKEALRISDLRIIDLSADYRLNSKNYEKYYSPHLDEENLAHAVYGLPEFYANSIAQARLVANPGCYPTATLLALLPFLKWISGSVFIDAKSGVSGAGKSPTPTTHYPHINENIFAYQPLSHRHEVEIEEKCQQYLQSISYKECPSICFVPHLMPLNEGMLVSIFSTLKDCPKEVHGYLREFYKDQEFIRVREEPVDVACVRGSNFCDLFVCVREKNLFISSAIDNLMRGASSQAVVNANLMYGFPANTGIPIF